jgi:hypothetical protein
VKFCNFLIIIVGNHLNTRKCHWGQNKARQWRLIGREDHVIIVFPVFGCALFWYFGVIVLILWLFWYFVNLGHALVEYFVITRRGFLRNQCTWIK